MHVAQPEFFYFDMGNVLLAFDHEMAVQRVSRLTGVDTSLVRHTIFGSGLEARYERGELTTDEFHAEFVARTGAEIDVETLAHACSDIFTPLSEVWEIVARLHESGRRVGLLSNTCDAHWRFVYPGRHAELWRRFELFALSFQLRSLKPEPTIYLQAAELTGVPLDKIFFVDDRLENIEQARELGIDAVLFESSAKLRDDLARRGLALGPT